jgi:hypothetical protein
MVTYIFFLYQTSYIAGFELLLLLLQKTLREKYLILSNFQKKLVKNFENNLIEKFIKKK